MFYGAKFRNQSRLPVLWEKGCLTSLSTYSHFYVILKKRKPTINGIISQIN